MKKKTVKMEIKQHAKFKKENKNIVQSKKKVIEKTIKQKELEKKEI